MSKIKTKLLTKLLTNVGNAFNIKHNIKKIDEVEEVSKTFYNI